MKYEFQSFGQLNDMLFNYIHDYYHTCACVLLYARVLLIARARRQFPSMHARDFFLTE